MNAPKIKLYLVSIFTLIALGLFSQSNLNTFLTEIEKSSSSQLVSIANSVDPTGHSHLKYKQMFNGLDIYGGQFIIHHKDDQVISTTGDLFNINSIDTSPSLSSKEIKITAQNKMKLEGFDKTNIEACNLILIDAEFPKKTNNFVLAYQLIIHSQQPLDKRNLIIDATSADIIFESPLIFQESTPTQGLTKYHGEQSFICERIDDNEYSLVDLTRGNGIFTYNTNDEYFKSTTEYWEPTDETGDAIGAHFGASSFYDLLMNKYNWNGIDGLGGALNSQVAIATDGDLVNAYWDGEQAHFGKGDCNHGSLTTLNVVGHEFMHGVTQNTSDLIYFQESGAINESLSDIFGKALEYYYDPSSFTWELGISIIEHPNAVPFRNMADPKSLGMPAEYKGENYSDYADVHTKSAIGNRWFQLLVDGGNGNTEKDIPYSINPIGMDVALDIVWNTNRFYLLNNSTYKDFKEGSLEMTKNMYGMQSSEYESVENAWIAVGGNSMGNVIYKTRLHASLFEFESRVCQEENAFQPLKVRVYNYSDINYFPEDSIEIIVSVLEDGDTIAKKSVLLVDTIAVNNEVIIEFPDIIDISDSGTKFIKLSQFLLKNNQRTPIEGYGQYLRCLSQTPNNITFNIFNTEVDCGVQPPVMNYQIVNMSCDEIKAGSILNIEYYGLENQELLLSDEVDILSDIQPGGFESFIFFLELGQGRKGLKIKSWIDEDEQIAITIDSFSYFAPLDITQDYYNPLTQNSINDNYLIRNSSSSPMIPFEYQGEEYLSSTGHNLEDEFYPCIDENLPFDLDNINLGLYSLPKISTCIDYSTIDNGIISFDALQFYNDSRSNSPDINEYYNLIITEFSKQSFSKIDYIHLEEGMKENIKIEIPEGFKGKFSATFFSHTGLGDTIDLVYDVNMIRNLKIGSGTSTLDHQIAESIKLYPNPTSEKVHIESDYKIETVKIYNSSGELLISSTLPENSLNISSLANGFYIAQMRLANGQNISKPIIKMKSN